MVPPWCRRHHRPASALDRSAWPENPATHTCDEAAGLIPAIPAPAGERWRGSQSRAEREPAEVFAVKRARQKRMVLKLRDPCSLPGRLEWSSKVFLKPYDARLIVHQWKLLSRISRPFVG